MLHHLSLNAHDTDRVATALAEILDGTVIAAPSPPFHPSSRFVCTWDERGTMVEIGPWGATWQPDSQEQSDVVDIQHMPEHNYFHGLFLARIGIDGVLAVARREGWRGALVDNGPFQVVNVWFENRQLIEFTTPELLPDYVATFGPANREHLDGQLRELERMAGQGLDQPCR
jgi:hypothetical protein